METYSQMSPPQLAAACGRSQPDGQHEPFCFELFRRAIVENCALCWQYLHNQYYALVRHWAFRLTSSDPDTIDDLTQEAFVNFLRFYTSEKISRATGLAAVLSYLKSCVASTVAQTRRLAGSRVVESDYDEEVINSQTSDDSAETIVLHGISAHTLWTAIQECCTSESDLIVARLVLVADLKPQAIAQRHPELFPEVAAVYRIKRNLIDRLRRHPVLRDMHQND
jgi:DNA-directed RNA polymerase specialized sigma24 family protein